MSGGLERGMRRARQADGDTTLRSHETKKATIIPKGQRNYATYKG